jgi:putative transposase
MARRPRELIDGGIYHVYNRGNNKGDLFTLNEDFHFFLECLMEAKSLFSVDIFHYCLMNNHFHLLLRVKTAESLPQFMHKVQLRFARFFKNKYSSVGHVFQERYRSPRVPEESYYLQCGRYIEKNPIRAGIVDDAFEYPWSSAKHYGLGAKDSLITTSFHYNELGETIEKRIRAYREFLLLDDPYEAMISEGLKRS